MNTTNVSDVRRPRTNKITTTVIIGGLALVVGLFFGAVAAEAGSGSIITQPKADAATPVTSSGVTSAPTAANLGNWNPFQAMHAMQAQMDQSFDQIFQQFRASPAFTMFKENPGYSLALNVRDLKDHYEVQAYLPDAKASDVHVNLNKGKTLDVEVTSQQAQASNQKNLATSAAEWGQYEEQIQLPTPVKAGQMKIQREGHELEITIPKAT